MHALTGDVGHPNTARRPLAHEDEAQEAFPNGILWVTIGQQPQLAACQHQIAQAFLGRLPPLAGAQRPRGPRRRMRYGSEQHCSVRHMLASLITTRREPMV